MKRPFSAAGAALGVLIALLMVSWMMVQSAWAILLAPLFVVLIIGLALFGGFYPPKAAFMNRQMTLVLLIYLGWPAALVAPYYLRYTQYLLISNDLPAYPGSEEVTSVITVMKADNEAGPLKKYKTDASLADILTFYDGEMRKMQCLNIEQWIGTQQWDGKLYIGDITCGRKGVWYKVRVDTSIGVISITARR